MRHSPAVRARQRAPDADVVGRGGVPLPHRGPRAVPPAAGAALGGHHHYH